MKSNEEQRVKSALDEILNNNPNIDVEDVYGVLIKDIEKSNIDVLDVPKVVLINRIKGWIHIETIIEEAFSKDINELIEEKLLD